MIAADANVLIRLLEGDSEVRQPLEARLAPYRGQHAFLAISRLAVLECRVKPMRNRDVALLSLWESFFASPEIRLVEVDRLVILKATEIRSELKFKTPDAIHLASAIVVGASRFLTADRGFLPCREISIDLI